MPVKIWFDPLSLKVLATKVVIRERMDYADYLGGKVKDELDQLDRLAGRQVIKATGLYVRKGKYQLSNNEWKSLKKRLPVPLIAFLSGKQEFSIFEKNEAGKREWLLEDVDGTSQRLQLTSQVKEKDSLCSYRGSFIADGALVKFSKSCDPEGELLVNGIDYIDVHRENGIFRRRKWHLPNLQIRITKDMWTLKEDIVPCTLKQDFLTRIVKTSLFAPLSFVTLVVKRLQFHLGERVSWQSDDPIWYGLACVVLVWYFVLWFALYALFLFSLRLI